MISLPARLCPSGVQTLVAQLKCVHANLSSVTVRGEYTPAMVTNGWGHVGISATNQKVKLII